MFHKYDKYHLLSLHFKVTASFWVVLIEHEITGLLCAAPEVTETYFYYNSFTKVSNGIISNEIALFFILLDSVGSLLKDPNFMSSVTLILLPPLRIE